jgi:hypothetical protein
MDATGFAVVKALARVNCIDAGESWSRFPSRLQEITLQRSGFRTIGAEKMAIRHYVLLKDPVFEIGEPTACSENLLRNHQNP